MNRLNSYRTHYELGNFVYFHVRSSDLFEHGMRALHTQLLEWCNTIVAIQQSTSFPI